MNGNVTREGITADLEAMKRVGLGGVTVFSIDGQDCVPPGPVTVLTPAWYELMQHALQEASRLGLKFGVMNCPGWAQSGGPWITPEHAMSFVVTSERRVQGPLALAGEALPQPQTHLGFYRDIAVLAFPTPPVELISMRGAGVRITASDPGFDGAGLWAESDRSPAYLAVPTKDKPQSIVFEFPAPFEVRAITLALAKLGETRGEIEASDDGVTFRKLRSFDFRQPVGGAPVIGAQHYAIKATAARFFRITFRDGKGEKEKLGITQLELRSAPAINEPLAKADFIRGAAAPRVADALTPELVLARDRMIDLTNQLDATGRLTWQVPEGNWTLLRIGYTPSLMQNRATPRAGRGPECDKMSRAAVDQLWEGMMAKVIANAGPLAGKAFDQAHLDSWEVGCQNWTPAFREEFRKRCGYDLLRYLPVLTGRIVDSEEESERFLWDYRRTIADLMADHYFGYMTTLAHRSGLYLSVEPYGDGPFDGLRSGGACDVPMAEFLLAGHPAEDVQGMRAVASIGHVYGKRVIGAEAFTGRAADSRWQQTPEQLKALGDNAFICGINQLSFHRYAHQPWLDRWPGITMGPWGTNLERTNTWWEQSRAWITYLSRCQYLLQQGTIVADILSFSGENSPNGGGLPQWPGYGADSCNADVILNRLSVKEGRLVLPDGPSYRLLVLGSSREMTPALLKKLGELAEAGATIIGPKPSKSPSLAGYPQCDEEVRTLAEALWQSGKITDQPALKALEAKSCPPDFQSEGDVLQAIHRVAADRDLYFVNNPTDTWREVTASFRVTGKTPELWNPVTGQIEQAPVFSERDGRTRVPLRLGPWDSVFVVFSTRAKGIDPVVSFQSRAGTLSPIFPAARLLPDAQGALALEAWQPGTYDLEWASGQKKTFTVDAPEASFELVRGWRVQFQTGRGAPLEIALAQLTSWTEHSDAGVKYFSGTATYSQTFDVPADFLKPGHRFYLDLGKVANLAEVRLNGRDLGIIWKRPFVTEVTEALRVGTNTLEIQITNLWVNRLIGDEQLPPDGEWRPMGWVVGWGLQAWPEWLVKGQPRPAGRITFTTYRGWSQSAPLLESGLIGPVKLHRSTVQPLPR